jgi:hypothetical protein
MKVINHRIRVNRGNLDEHPAFSVAQKGKDKGKMYFVEWVLMDVAHSFEWDKKIKWFKTEKKQIKFLNDKRMEYAKRLFGGEVVENTD